MGRVKTNKRCFHLNAHAFLRLHRKAITAVSVAVAAIPLVSAAPAGASAIYDPGTLLFQTSNQSMWDTGSAAVQSYSGFLGTTWNANTGTIGTILGNQYTQIPGTGGYITISVPNPAYAGYLLCKLNPFGSCGSAPSTTISKSVPNPISAQYVDTRTGATIDATTTGKAGFNLGYSFNSGSVDAKVSYDATAKLPNSVSSGGYFNLNPASSMAGVHDLSTTFPQVSGHVDAVVNANFSATGTGCLTPLGCKSGTVSPKGINATVPLVSFNEPNGSGIAILGTGSPAYNFGQPINIGAPGYNLGSVTVNTPNLQTTGTFDSNTGTLNASGVSPFINLRANLLGIAEAAAGIPTVTGLSVNDPTGLLSLGYDLLTLQAGPDLNIVQNFKLTPNLMTTLQFSSPVNILGKDVTSYTGAWDSLPDIQLLNGNSVTVSPKFFLDAQLTNQTGLGIAGAFSIDALDANASINIGGVSFPIAQFGPLYHFDTSTGTLSLPPILDNTFSLGGFNSINGTPITLGASGVQLATNTTQNYDAVLTTGTPAIMSQLVANPGNEFQLAFDYMFKTGTGNLKVMLELAGMDITLGDLTGPGMAQTAFNHFSDSYSYADLCAQFGGVSCDANSIFNLVFNFDDTNPGSTLLLDNIFFSDLTSGSNFLLNGNFQTGNTANWQINDSQHVAVVANAANLIATPEPATLAVFLFGLLGMGMLRRKRVI